MNDKRYQYILYLIVLVTMSTITIQLFWNYKNYQNNKQQVFNDIQWSLDNAVETYYSTLSKDNFLTIVNASDDNINFNDVEWDTLLKPFKKNIKPIKDHLQVRDTTITITSIDISSHDKGELDSINGDFFNDIFTSYNKPISNDKTPKDTIKINRFTQLSEDKSKGLTFDRDEKSVTASSVFWGKKSRDSLKLIKGLSTIYIAMQQDSIDYKTLDSLLVYELKNKGVSNHFYLSHFKNNDLIYSSKAKNQPTFALEKKAKTTYLKTGESIALNFKNPVSETFKRSLLGLSLSTLLIVAVISCLFYLLKIIKHQKQLAEVKNDLISNITHEFKTPIATIGVALESFQNFNAINDKAKTKTYLEMSNTQLSKLTTMVEKLLETATLDSENLELHLDEYNISEVIRTIADKYKLQDTNKSIIYHIEDQVFAKVDGFHFENAINNLIDNAYKYGGDSIQVYLKRFTSHIEISISDNGNSLTKANKDQIFEKFYRVPKGNTHDVKGFGIGLYYAKKIIEKHNGSIHLELSPKETAFKISLPHV